MGDRPTSAAGRLAVMRKAMYKRRTLRALAWLKPSFSWLQIVFPSVTVGILPVPRLPNGVDANAQCGGLPNRIRHFTSAPSAWRPGITWRYVISVRAIVLYPSP